MIGEYVFNAWTISLPFLALFLAYLVGEDISLNSIFETRTISGKLFWYTTIAADLVLTVLGVRWFGFPAVIWIVILWTCWAWVWAIKLFICQRGKARSLNRSE